MIFGIGTDIVDVSRMKKWVDSGSLIERFFNKKECKNFRSVSKACEYYANRFAAKEAFSKALGTGLSGFDLRDVFVLNDENGRPFVVLENSAEKIFKKMCGNSKIHISLSNEKQFAVAYVIIESEN